MRGPSEENLLSDAIIQTTTHLFEEIRSYCIEELKNLLRSYVKPHPLQTILILPVIKRMYT